jgi:hypothetical protein
MIALCVLRENRGWEDYWRNIHQKADHDSHFQLHLVCLGLARRVAGFLMIDRRGAIALDEMI